MKHKPGDIINHKYMVLGLLEGRALLAKSIRQDAAEPYVVWHLDSQGETYSGIYTPDRRVALREFIGLCRGYRCFAKAEAEAECIEAGLQVLSEEAFEEKLTEMADEEPPDFRQGLAEEPADDEAVMKKVVDWLLSGHFSFLQRYSA